MNDDLDLESTRIAAIHPITGVEILVDPSPEDAPGDATVIGKPLIFPQRPRRLSAEFVPEINAKATGEITCAWRDNQDTEKTLKSIFKKVVDGIRNQKKFVLIFFLAVFTGAMFFLSGVKSSSPEKPVIQEIKTHDKVSSPQALSMKPSQVALAEPIENGTFKQAIDALINGDLVEAKRICTALSKVDQSDPALQIALKIMSKKGGDGK